MKKIPLIVLIFTLTWNAWSQNTPQPDEKDQVMKVVQQLFEAMRKGDSTGVRNVFDPSARLQTSFVDYEGKASLLNDDIDNFANAVGSKHEDIWDEHLWSWTVNVDGNLASVWAEYTFYAGARLSHCGVDVFQLFKGANGWKIFQLTDTRHQNNCEDDPKHVIDLVLNRWHHAAATADEDTFFGSMTQDAVYVGTDAAERWTRDEMREWSKKYFDRDTAWAFTPIKREVYLSDDGLTGWFEENLDTWMGVCRGSGVLHKELDGWKIKHYVLSVTVPNPLINQFIEMVKKGAAPAPK